jgi:hypothetical protein
MSSQGHPCLRRLHVLIRNGWGVIGVLANAGLKVESGAGQDSEREKKKSFGSSYKRLAIQILSFWGWFPYHWRTNCILRALNYWGSGERYLSGII